MTQSARPSSFAWILVLCGALGYVVWTDAARMRRVEHVTHTDSEDVVIDAASPTGYAGGKRWLIVPERNSRSYEWIAQTQQMLAQGGWRVRHVDYDNPPAGREVHSASLYRWWLGFLAWIDHAVTGHPLGLSVERAALWSEPLLHLLLLVGTTVFVARQFGNVPAVLMALGLATVFPLAGGFLPGVPDDHSLSRACALWSVLPLLAALLHRHPSPLTDINRTRRYFAVAGIAGGFGLWINASHEAPIVVGIAVGGILAPWFSARRTPAPTDPERMFPALPWRAWAWSGAAVSVAGYLVEYLPSHLGLQLEVNHPLHASAWVGLGELLAQTGACFRQRTAFWKGRRLLVVLGSVAALLALPVVMWLRGMHSPWAGDILASRLTFQPNGVVATDVSIWIKRDGLSGALAATCLPLLLVAVAVPLVFRREARSSARAGLVIALGPAVFALAFAVRQLSWWNMFDAVLLALAVGMVAAAPTALASSRRRWLGAALLGLIVIPGVWQLRPLGGTAANFQYTGLEVMGLIERTLAHWIADHAEPEGAVILVPPERTISMCFHGGLRGLGSGDRENRDGLAASGRIAASITGEEALARLNEHGVNTIVLPSWDSDLDEFARWMLHDPEDAFITALHHWELPVWLRPLPYKLPANIGFDDQSVVILQVTDDSSRPAATARLAEYFLETGQMQNAARSAKALERYPTDLGALAALAQVDHALGHMEAFTKTLDTVQASLAAGADRALAWDRRVSLAIALALGQRNDLARAQVQRCLEKVNAARLRALTTGSLYRLQVLGRAFGRPIADPTLHELARKLLPAELRARL